MDDLERILRAIITIRAVEEPALVDEKVEAIRREFDERSKLLHPPTKSGFTDYLHEQLLARGFTGQELSVAGIRKGTVIRALERRPG